MIKIEAIIGTIRILEVGTTLYMIGIDVNMIKVIEATLQIETGQMIEIEVGLEIIKEDDFAGLEQTMDLGIELDPP